MAKNWAGVVGGTLPNDERPGSLLCALGSLLQGSQTNGLQRCGTAWLPLHSALIRNLGRIVQRPVVGVVVDVRLARQLGLEVRRGEFGRVGYNVRFVVAEVIAEP